MCIYCNNNNNNNDNNNSKKCSPESNQRVALASCYYCQKKFLRRPSFDLKNAYFFLPIV